tara:strand:- start:302 stop:463 length:162 start_codon:yes stop_codon:yes gene_type:complete
MAVELKDVLIVIVEQRNDALNKLAESVAQNRAISQELEVLKTSQEKSEEVVDK